MLTNPSPPQRREVAGFLLSLAFAGLAAVRDVYFGGLFQRVNPLGVALIAFGLCTLGFLPTALARDRGGLAALVRRPARLLWINATTALAWLSFFFALRTIEPALVQILFYGIGPLSVRWVDRLVPGSLQTTLTPVERWLHLGLLSALAVTGAVGLSGLSGFGSQSVAVAAVGIALAVGGGVSISISTLLCRTLNDSGVRPATLFALRFPGAVGLAAVFGLASPAPLLSGITPGALGTVTLACLLLIVLPNYVNQMGVALASPVTVRAVLAVGPVLVFVLQLFDGRLSPSPATLGACVLYGVCAVAAAVARRHAIGAMVGRPGTQDASRSGSVLSLLAWRARPSSSCGISIPLSSRRCGPGPPGAADPWRPSTGKS
jgi:drug/metabolite transporter (DMT)-like permease